MGRSRGGLTSKIHAVVDRNGLPVGLALKPEPELRPFNPFFEIALLTRGGVRGRKRDPLQRGAIGPARRTCHRTGPRAFAWAQHGADFMNSLREKLGLPPKICPPVDASLLGGCGCLAGQVGTSHSGFTQVSHGHETDLVSQQG
jgi:hypothetical protein